jgi:hypothetical protein
MRKSLWAGAVFTSALTFATTSISAPVSAGVIDHFTLQTFERIGPMVTDDLPCLEGTRFVATGTKATKTRVLETDRGFHFFFSEHNENRLVPVSGSGPTYVEQGNQDHLTFNRNFSHGTITFSHVNNDRFVPYRGGKRTGDAIRIHEHETFVAVDTDGDGAPDDIRLDRARSRLTC